MTPVSGCVLYCDIIANTALKVTKLIKILQNTNISTTAHDELTGAVGSEVGVVLIITIIFILIRVLFLFFLGILLLVAVLVVVSARERERLVRLQ